MPPPKRPSATAADREIVTFSVAGYKSIHDHVDVPVAPLTIVAGANSSGKSSFMQPFLMMKQTLESPFDPGTLLIHGPNVQLSEWSQALSRGKSRTSFVKELSIALRQGSRGIENTYQWSQGTGLTLSRTTHIDNTGQFDLSPELDSKTTESRIPGELLEEFRAVAERFNGFTRRSRSRTNAKQGSVSRIAIRQRKLFLEAIFELHDLRGGEVIPIGTIGSQNIRRFSHLISSIIHVPGLRGNPERSYTSASGGPAFPGTFEKYVASIISRWQSGNPRDKAKLAAVAHDLDQMGLTWKIASSRVDDASVELRVGRTPRPQQGGALDLVNIADVGFGVSQTLPVLVAIHVAQPGQIVYIEQPELHLHPRAQTTMGYVLVDAARRGVRVLAETHSSLIIRSIQTAIAAGRIPSKDVRFNWFSRDNQTGFSQVETASIDTLGRFGDWPVDFDDVSEESDWKYVQTVGRNDS